MGDKCVSCGCTVDRYVMLDWDSGARQQRFDSALKAWNYCIEWSIGSATISYRTYCPKCRYINTVLERTVMEYYVI